MGSSIVIIPGNAIIIEEGKKFALVLLKTLFVAQRHVTPIVALGKFCIKLLNTYFVFIQKARFQSTSVYCLNHGPEKQGELLT